MRRFSLLLFVTVVVSLGCDHNDYQIVLTPKGTTLVRQITFARVNRTPKLDGPPVEYRPFPEEELRHLANLYGKKPEDRQQPGPRTYRKTFPAGPLPKDVGGAGSYTALASSLGTTRYYSERFRGDDDQAGQLRRGFEAIDVLADLFAGWLKNEFGKQEQFDKLEAFIRGDLRRDAHNVLMMTWMLINAPRLMPTGDKSAREDMQKALVARGVQYLMERDYIRPSDIPVWVKQFTSETGPGGDGPTTGPSAPPSGPALENEGRKVARDLIATILQRKAGLTNRKLIDLVTEFLTDENAFDKSFLAYFRKSKHYAKALARLKAMNPPEPGEASAEPRPEEVAQALALDLGLVYLMFNLGTDDALTVTLKLASPPLATNGVWDAGAGCVRWKGTMSPRAHDGLVERPPRRLPLFCYAAWIEVDAKFQTQHFGTVLLAGEDLMKYCLWRAGLDKAQRAKWDEFLASQKPGPKLVDNLKDFRLTAPLPGQDPDECPDPARAGVKMLADALQGKDKQEPKD